MILKTSFFPINVIDIPHLKSSVNRISAWFPQQHYPQLVSSRYLSNIDISSQWYLSLSISPASLMSKSFLTNKIHWIFSVHLQQVSCRVTPHILFYISQQMNFQSRLVRSVSFNQYHLNGINLAKSSWILCLQPRALECNKFRQEQLDTLSSTKSSQMQ